MERPASYRPLGAARDAGLRVNMTVGQAFYRIRPNVHPSKWCDAGLRVIMTVGQAFCAVPHAAGVHKSSVGARDGYRRFVVP